jgi:hypothetical protein
LGEKGPNSTKRGSLSNFSTLAAGSRVRRLLSLLELTRNTWAVREIPKVSATLAADAHSVSGIRARPLRVARHRSNRRRTASSRAGRLSVCLVPIGHPPQCSVSAGYDTTTVKMIHARLPQGHDDSDSGLPTGNNHWAGQIPLPNHLFAGWPILGFALSIGASGALTRDLDPRHVSGSPAGGSLGAEIGFEGR